MTTNPNPSETGLLDTNVVIQLPTITDASLLPRTPRICVVTLAELAIGPLVARSTAESARRQNHLQQVESAFDPIPLDAVAARVYGEVALDLRRKGRKASSRAFGALIAACAIANGLSLYTANPSDFEGIERLDVVTVPQMG